MVIYDRIVWGGVVEASVEEVDGGVVFGEDRPSLLDWPVLA
jgi:hypothetical protein